MIMTETFFQKAGFSQQFSTNYLMGPNAGIIVDELTKGLPLKKGMRVLDLGCGMGLTSIFLAKTFDVTVFAADLWISPTDNFATFIKFGVDQQVYPISAEAHALPFAEGFFDAIISVDSYHYFGAEPGYLEKHLVSLVKLGGLIAMAIPGLQKDFVDNVVPDVLKPYLPENANFYSCDYWRNLWEKSGVVDVVECDSMTSCKQAWDDWLACDNEYAIRDREMMAAENGQYFNLVKLVGYRRV